MDEALFIAKLGKLDVCTIWGYFGCDCNGISGPLSLLLLGNPQGCANIDLGVKERIDRLWKGLLA
jgi:hypothetical protein